MFWRTWWLAVVLVWSCASASAGEMTHARMVQRYPPPFIVGSKDSEIPVWPIFQQNATENKLVAYAFESVDLAPIPGFSGVPVNLLVLLDPSGGFMDVQLVSQHEPVFLDGLGEGALVAFLQQYKNLSLKQNIRIWTGSAKTASGASVQIDGVSKATASVRIINQSILSAALKVARKKLGYAEGRDPELVAHVLPGVLETHTLAGLLDSGLVQHLQLRNRDVERAFVGTPGTGLDADATAQPDGLFIDLVVAYVSVPSIGRSLLSDASWAALQGRLDEGDQAILVMSKGRYDLLGDNFVRGTTPERIALSQNQLPIEMRDLNLDLALKDATGLDMSSVAVFRVIAQAGLDPARTLHFALPITRLKGQVYPEKITQVLGLDFTLPERFYTAPEGDNKTWRSIWHDRQWELAVLLAGLLVLAVALVLQRRLVAQARRFALFRTGYLLFTLFFIGWFAQGQLSIVNFTSVLQALLAGRGLGFFLYDPMTVILSAFTLVSLVLWGRGTFCGWLCPFGALQEFSAQLGAWLKVPRIRFKPVTDRRLKGLKYVVLAGILASAVAAPALTDRLVEVEPFKTAITLNFVRSWPFVLYALGLLVASMVVTKFFCRYLCPLGAGLAVLGRLRLLDWIPRRAACGTPCQTCRHRCDYQAIAPSGEVQYDECFQCMDCVVVYASDDLCAPLLLDKKRAKTIAIQPIA